MWKIYRHTGSPDELFAELAGVSLRRPLVSIIGKELGSSFPLRGLLSGEGALSGRLFFVQSWSQLKAYYVVNKGHISAIISVPEELVSS